MKGEWVGGYEKDGQPVILFYPFLICSALCSLNSRHAHQKTDSLLVCVETDKDTWRKREQKKQEWYLFFLLPPSHTEMFLSLPWEHECKTSALVPSSISKEDYGNLFACRKKMFRAVMEVEIIFWFW